MKIVILSLILSFPLFLNGDDEPIDHDRLEQREVNGEQLHFIIDNKTLFTGSTIERYENGQKKWVRKFKDGMLEGITIGWYDNGQKKYTANWKFGKEDGLETWWHKNGTKKRKLVAKMVKRTD
jgi:antitoxin component YwqK of YwqJK toxin-antitoxin module